MMGLIKTLDALHPKARTVMEALIEGFKQRGIRFAIVETLRTAAVQAAYYAQGRQSLDQVNTLRKQAGLYLFTKSGENYKITNVTHSSHEDGFAADIVPVLPSGSIPWNVVEYPGMWRAMGDVGLSLGLDWGGTWAPLNRAGIGWDAPHYQLMR
ncbi:MAG: M15 family metallopeptidase [Treponema sp.]|nr:M15 family metallopeptidase [Treponema sp.]